MSGFASATVVIEAGWKSGARMQARLALQHGRPVFLMDQLREHDWARELGDKPGAHFVSSVDEIVTTLERICAASDELIDS
jgi:DNA processing protein